MKNFGYNIELLEVLLGGFPAWTEAGYPINKELAVKPKGKLTMLWSKIKSKKSNLRPNDIQVIKGNYNKAKKLLRWKPKTKFKDLVRIMVEEDIKRWKKFLDKEPQPWDLIQY